MQVNITGHHVDVTESVKDYVNEKMGKLTRHFDHVTIAHVILTIENQDHKAEATVHTSGTSGNGLFAQHIGENMYASIDGMVDKLDRQIIKHKEKISSHDKKSGGARSLHTLVEEV